jgi:hypothetical protein
MHVQILAWLLFASLSTKALRKLKRQYKSGAKTLRDYAKEQPRENMGQSKSKERGFKQGFKDFRSKVLKNCEGQ